MGSKPKPYSYSSIESGDPRKETFEKNPKGKNRQRQRNRFFDDLTTIKISSPDPVLLSKITADITTQYKVQYASSILFNGTSRQYFAYLNLDEKAVKEKLQEVSPYGSAQT